MKNSRANLLLKKRESIKVGKVKSWIVQCKVLWATENGSSVALMVLLQKTLFGTFSRLVWVQHKHTFHQQNLVCEAGEAGWLENSCCWEVLWEHQHTSISTPVTPTFLAFSAWKSCTNCHSFKECLIINQN